MENLYDIIGVSPSVSDEELDSAYKKLREKYGEERFQNGPAGEEAADKLEKLLDDPTLLRTPIVRNGKQATVGYCPEVWETWT